MIIYIQTHYIYIKLYLPIKLSVEIIHNRIKIKYCYIKIVNKKNIVLCLYINYMN